MKTKEQRQLIEDKKCIEFLISLHETLLKNPKMPQSQKDAVAMHIKELQDDLKLIGRKGQ